MPVFPENEFQACQNSALVLQYLLLIIESLDTPWLSHQNKQS